MRFFGAILGCIWAVSVMALPLHELQLPPHFSITTIAKGLDKPRHLSVSPEGVVFVGSSNDTVVALIPTSRRFTSFRTHVIAQELKTPNGVAFFQGDLYVAETAQLRRYPNILSYLKARVGAADIPSEIIRRDFPRFAWHGRRVIRFSPRGELFMGVGAPCNVCLKPDARLASIVRMRTPDAPIEVMAYGVRNTVGIDFHPVTRELWFSDNGRDHMGDDLPPDELNRLRIPGSHFGFPFQHGNGIFDPKFGARAPKGMRFVPPVFEFQAHTAPLGIWFYRGKQFPASYRNTLFVAQHGSWNRTRPVGYQVLAVAFERGRPVSATPFVSGFLNAESAWGRPVDVAELPDGSLIISDDKAGAVYRVTYRAPSLY